MEKQAIRMKRDFGPQPISADRIRDGLEEVIGSSFGGLYFVKRNGIRYALIAPSPIDAILMSAGPVLIPFELVLLVRK